MKIAGYVRANRSLTNDRVLHFCDALGSDLISTREVPVDCDLAVQAGFQISPAMEDAMARGIPIIILENPVWGKKDGVYTWAYNGLNGLGWVPPCDELAPRARPACREWRDWESGEITIFGQVPNDKALRGADIGLWVDGIQSVIPTARFREHPIMLDRPEEQEPFSECLARTGLAITYSSTVGPQCVIKGIPTIAQHEGSLAWDVTTHTLSDDPITPERATWLHRLAFRHIGTDPFDIDRAYVLGGYEEAREMVRVGGYDNMSNGRPQ